MMRTVLTLAFASALILASADARIAAQGASPPTVPEAKPEPGAPPKPTEGDGTKPEGEAAKPEEGPGTEVGTADTPQPESSPVSLAELVKDGFEIHATQFIPAEAVTRQSGKVSSDAILVTLQKTTATAVCFYTLKAYVGKKLTTILACTVHR